MNVPTPQPYKGEKYKLNFNESAIMNPQYADCRGGRIEIYPLHDGLIDLMDKEEITVVLPAQMWVDLREKLDGLVF